jgi:hypothetical protein
VSESTEKWDWSGIATDFASHDYDNKNGFFREARMTYHQERVGIYTALTFAGASPDIVVECDLTPGILKGYKVLYLVGDSIAREVVPALEQWVNDGGVLFATAGVGRYGMYREPNPELQKLVGIESRQIEERDTFIRTSQELPFLKPISRVLISGEKAEFPALATRERIMPSDDANVIAMFDDKERAAITRELGKGKVYYVAALPGLAYLYKGVTTPRIHVPDRGPGAHRAVNTYDGVAANLILRPLRDAGVQPTVTTEPGYIDTRLLEAKGVYFLPIANYHEKVDQPVTLRITPGTGGGKPVRATSAFLGEVELDANKDAWVIKLPKLGYGDIVRIDLE